jgi:hypothetical protein
MFQNSSILGVAGGRDLERGMFMLTNLLRFINEQHGTAFVPRGRYPAGEQGAFAISEEDGEEILWFVLKWTPGTEVPDNLRQAADVTSRPRGVGYPAPRYRLIGVAPPLEVVYSIQEELPGVPFGGRLDRHILDRLLELNGLQREQAVAPSKDWPKTVSDSVLYGGDGFCLLESLRSYSAASAALLGVVQQLVIAGIDERSPTDDIVHFDFQGSNILVDRAGVRGVVDWEGCCAGDCAFDLTTLFFYADASEEAQTKEVDRLWRLLVGQTSPRMLGVYLAHLILRQIDWSIRFHDRNAVERWLVHADNMLARLSAATETDITSGA